MKQVHITSITLVLLSFGLTGCAELLDPNYGYGGNPYGNGYSGNGYNGGGYGNGGYYDPYYNNNRRREQRLNQEEEELREERRRIDAQRRQVEAQREAQSYSPPPQQRERCPSGFSPSENKCSKAERRNGCRDMRLPGGLGCVSR
jgi:hypothetical protein